MMHAMNEHITATLTVTFEDEGGRQFSDSVTATVQLADLPADAGIVESSAAEPGTYLENLASNHK